MHFDLATRIATLGVGEMATFALGPRSSRGGAGGLWRAQLGQHWHSELRRRSEEEPGARFEVPIVGDYPWRGWIFRLAGRIDQFLPSPAGGVVLRELKTVTRPLPTPVHELQAEFPEYFVQLAAYLILYERATRANAGASRADEEPIGPAGSPRSEPSSRDPVEPAGGVRGELVFIEAGSGLVQPVSAPAASAAILHGQLDELVGFLEARRRAYERRRALPVRTAFALLRPGQEHVQRDLRAALGLSAVGPSDDAVPSPSGSPIAKLASTSSDSDEAKLASVSADSAVGSVLTRASASSFDHSALRTPHSAIPPVSGILCFEAPTGFGKTGCLLEFALSALKEGTYDRLVYLTGKSTGQLQVVRQLEVMLALEPPTTVATPPETRNTRPETRAQDARLPYWQVRSKAEHCVNSVYHCLPDACPFLAEADERWPGSGLARFYLLDGEPRDLESLRHAGRDARICPYEITRAALPFNDVWVGDYNYVFAPANRGLFFEQPGFDPAATLLIVDEAHNLPARVADAYSHAIRAADAWATWDALRSARAPVGFLHAWEAWARELDSLAPCEVLDGATEIGLRAAANRLALLVPGTALDFVALGPRVSELLWQLPSLDEFLDAADLPKLLWCPARGELRVTCLDAASAIAETLRRFRHAILTSATLNPPDAFAAACGLDLPVGPTSPVAKLARVPARSAEGPPLADVPSGSAVGSMLARASDSEGAKLARASSASEVGRAVPGAPPVVSATDNSPPSTDHRPSPTNPIASLGKLPRAARKALKGITTGAALLRAEEESTPVLPPFLRADAPWRRGAYRVAVDTRVDTRWERRTHHFDTTAATVAQLVAASLASVGDVRARASVPEAGPTLTDVPSPESAVAKLARTSSDSVLQPPAPSRQAAAFPVAVFFPSYAYAEAVAELCVNSHHLRIAQQPRGLDLAAQATFIDTSLTTHDALFLVLGTGYTEGIDLLGGRITHAMVVGPALPEVNAVQRAKLAFCHPKSRDAAFRQVYQVPGMQKVNQALGRLVRAPGQHATVLLHCRRFADQSYRDLLDPELRHAPALDSDELLAAWLSGHAITG
ncbi:MAG: helicase [Opitutaceae bacterium]|nr:helicase [Opitutaceae bacterium]